MFPFVKETRGNKSIFIIAISDNKHNEYSQVFRKICVLLLMFVWDFSLIKDGMVCIKQIDTASVAV